MQWYVARSYDLVIYHLVHFLFCYLKNVYMYVSKYIVSVLSRFQLFETFTGKLPVVLVVSFLCSFLLGSNTFFLCGSIKCTKETKVAKSSVLYELMSIRQGILN